jgi:hypothetical protein
MGLSLVADGAARLADLITTTANFFAVTVDPAAAFLLIARAGNAIATLALVARTSVRGDCTNGECTEHAKTDNAGRTATTSFRWLSGCGKS